VETKRYVESRLPAVALILGASTIGDVGVMPRFAVGGSVAVAGEYRRFRLEAHGELWSGQHASNPPNPSETVPRSFVAGGARLCYRALEGRMRSTELFLSPCATFDAGKLSGRRQGAVAGGDGLFDGVGASALAGISLTSHIFVRADGGIVVPLAAPRFVALASDGTVANQVFRSASVGARFGAGAEVRFF